MKCETCNDIKMLYRPGSGIKLETIDCPMCSDSPDAIRKCLERVDDDSLTHRMKSFLAGKSAKLNPSNKAEQIADEIRYWADELKGWASSIATLGHNTNAELEKELLEMEDYAKRESTKAFDRGYDAACTYFSKTIRRVLAERESKP